MNKRRLGFSIVVLNTVLLTGCLATVQGQLAQITGSTTTPTTRDHSQSAADKPTDSTSKTGNTGVTTPREQPLIQTRQAGPADLASKSESDATVAKIREDAAQREAEIKAAKAARVEDKKNLDEYLANRKREAEANAQAQAAEHKAQQDAMAKSMASSTCAAYKNAYYHALQSFETQQKNCPQYKQWNDGDAQYKKCLAQSKANIEKSTNDWENFKKSMGCE